MVLTVLERIALLNILPPEGNIVTLRIARKLRESLSFTEQECADMSIQQTDGRVSWNAASEPPEGTSIPMGERATDMIVEALRKLDRESKLTDQHFSVYEKFVKD